MFNNTRVAAMTYQSPSSPQQGYFLGAISLLAVAALTSALVGSVFGFVVLTSMIGVLCTRAQWARILTLVLSAYVGLVALLIGLFAHGTESLGGFAAATISAGILWLLVRPGMDRYFGAPPQTVSQVLPVQPRTGALPHLQPPQASATQLASVRPPTAPKATSTQEQWQRLQQQLRAEQEKEEREAESESQRAAKPFPTLTFVLTAVLYAYASSVSGELGKFSMLILVPAFVVAMLDWINPRVVILAILLLSGVLVLSPEWTIVAPGMHVLLQHQGPFIFAAAALLVYMIALCSSGFAGECENA
jgi:hypothetical protein